MPRTVSLSTGFFHWYEAEFEPPGFKNPLSKVKAPKQQDDPIKAVSLEYVFAMVATCRRRSKIDMRDHALLLTLIDTGMRARELLSLKVDDVNLTTGEILIRQGKGRKPRTVCSGQRTRKALRAYLKNRRAGILFLARDGEKLDVSGLRAIIRRRARAAGIAVPTLHSFRRAFAINCLRAGMDVFSLQKLLGHSDLGVLRRYLNQVTEDLRVAHAIDSPVDRAGL